jgi:hypothetical protein
VANDYVTTHLPEVEAGSTSLSLFLVIMFFRDLQIGLSITAGPVHPMLFSSLSF